MLGGHSASGPHPRFVCGDKPHSTTRMSHTYRIQYAPPGQRAIVKIHRTKVPLERGKWVVIDGTYLVVERLVPGKRGDAYTGVALCKLAMG